MSIQNEVFESFIAMADGLRPYADLLVGSLPADNGISAAIASGTATRHFDMGCCCELTVALNAKHKEQRTAFDTLCMMHEHFGRRKKFPHGANWQITAIQPLSLPQYLDRETSGQWLYGSSLIIKYYAKGNDRNENDV